MVLQASEVNAIALSVLETADITYWGRRRYFRGHSAQEILLFLAKLNEFAVWNERHMTQLPFLGLLVVIHYAKFLLPSPEVIVVVVLDHAETLHRAEGSHAPAQLLLVSEVHFLDFELQDVSKLSRVYL
jgi:hypothetical protein